MEPRIPITDNNPRNGMYMLTLFKEDMRKQLVAAAIEAIKPEVEKAAIRVVQEMEVELQQQFNLMNQELIVQFIQKGKTA